MLPEDAFDILRPRIEAFAQALNAALAEDA